MTFLPCVNTLDYLNTYEDFSGEEHAVFTSLTKEEIAALVKDLHFKKVLLEKYGALGELGGTYARPVYEKIPGKTSPDYEILEGRLPEKEDEILLDAVLAKKIQASCGDTLSFFDKKEKEYVFQVCGITKAALGTSIPDFYVSASSPKPVPYLQAKISA